MELSDNGHHLRRSERKDNRPASKLAGHPTSSYQRSPITGGQACDGKGSFGARTRIATGWQGYKGLF